MPRTLHNLYKHKLHAPLTHTQAYIYLTVIITYHQNVHMYVFKSHCLQHGGCSMTFLTAAAAESATHPLPHPHKYVCFLEPGPSHLQHTHLIITDSMHESNIYH